MKITKVEACAVQAKPTDRQAYWGSRTWGESGKVRATEISSEYPTPLRRRFIYSQTIDTASSELLLMMVLSAMEI